MLPDKRQSVLDSSGECHAQQSSCSLLVSQYRSVASLQPDLIAFAFCLAGLAVLCCATLCCAVLASEIGTNSATAVCKCSQHCRSTYLLLSDKPFISVCVCAAPVMASGEGEGDGSEVQQSSSGSSCNHLQAHTPPSHFQASTHPHAVRSP